LSVSTATEGFVTREELLDAVYTAWKHDIDAATSSLMIAPDTATVAELNRRARADRIAAGEVAEDGLTVAAGQMVGVGDHVVTRRNDRHLATGTGWVKNGDRWVVTATDDDGSMTARRAGGHGVIVLPAHYVAEHVELSIAPKVAPSGRPTLSSRPTRPEKSSMSPPPEGAKQIVSTSTPSTTLTPKPATITPTTLERPERCWRGCSPTPEPRPPPTRPSVEHNTNSKAGRAFTPSTRPSPRPPKPSAGTRFSSTLG
jgi:ribosomal protein L13E